jgi:mono/diheme cytochrome c family protein
VIRALFTLILLIVAALAILFGYARLTGLSARDEPSEIEEVVADRVRLFAIPAAVKRTANPVAASAEAMADGLAHFADHCAVCHANDGSGDTMFGKGLYPRPPDLRADTQLLTDGELFYIIEHGIRFTGMPAFGNGTAGGEESSWRLVHFLRRLPHLTDEERERVAALAPRSPEQIRQEIEEEQFLKGDQP